MSYHIVVILRAAKDLPWQPVRPFAALRMTKLLTDFRHSALAIGGEGHT